MAETSDAYLRAIIGLVERGHKELAAARLRDYRPFMSPNDVITASAAIRRAE